MNYRFADLELDDVRFELRRAGQPVVVQRRVLETILYLVRCRDRLVTRDELAHGPWAGSTVSDAAIAQAIKHAREVLGDDAAGQRLIRTVRGKGMRFVGEVEEVAEPSAQASARSAARSSVPPAPTSFIGRGGDLRLIGDRLDASFAGSGRCVLVTGEAGIGKTALLEEAAREAKLRGAEAFWGRGWEAGGTPAFWPWLELLRGIVESPGFGKAGTPPEGSTRWLQFAPEARGHLPVATPIEEPVGDVEFARVRMFDSVTRFLVWAASARDLLLVLEDLHVADRDSLALLRYAAPRIRSSRLLVLGSMRPDPAGAKELEVASRSDIESVALQGLSANEVGDLMIASGSRAAPDSVAEMHELTGGNPLMVRELSSASASALTDGDPSWESLPAA